MISLCELGDCVSGGIWSNSRSWPSAVITAPTLSKQRGLTFGNNFHNWILVHTTFWRMRNAVKTTVKWITQVYHSKYVSHVHAAMLPLVGQCQPTAVLALSIPFSNCLKTRIVKLPSKEKKPNKPHSSRLMQHRSNAASISCWLCANTGDRLVLPSVLSGEQ